MNIEDFFQDYRQDLIAHAGVESNYLRSTFVDKMCALIEEDGAIPDFTQVDYKHTQKGLAVDAWSYDPAIYKLTLFVSDFRDEEKLQTLTQKEVEDSFKRLTRFVEICHKHEFVKSLEEAMPVLDLARFILERHQKIKQLALVLLSNARISSRINKLTTNNVAEIKTTQEIWDVERIYRIETSGREREDIEIDFCSSNKNGIPCLPAHCEGQPMKSYLLVMPGCVIANLYEEHGERLLEQNVRTFLQFRGNINKGMRNTLINEPEMFFSFNNGLSATAEDVKTDRDGRFIQSVRNLQIVNGGQTTASIFTAQTKDGGGADLSKVYVQIKLTIVKPDSVDDVVPRISECANTQNKVSAADFFSNHPFHRKIEEFSRRMWAPAVPGKVHQTRWFYERARGQFINKQAGMTLSEKKKYLISHPKNQMFTKTDLAKYVRTFEGFPFEVSKGAQMNFSLFAGELGKKWDPEQGRTFNELWFQKLVAMAILFRNLDTSVLRAPWCNGYKANIITYALAKFSDLVKQKKRHIDFSKIWALQSTPEPLAQQLLQIAQSVNEIIINPPANATSNISEWAKKPACWDAVCSSEISLESNVYEYLLESHENKEIEKEAGRKDDIQVGIKTQTYVFEKGAMYWKALGEWNANHRKLTYKQVGCLEIACQIPRKVPTESQSEVIIEAEKSALSNGFFVG